MALNAEPATPTDETLTHIIRAADWRTALGVGSVAMAPEGFVHLSTTTQVAATAARFYSGCGDLQLLAVDESRTRAEVRWEEGEPGQLFPHVYGPLPVAAVLAVQPFPCDDAGTFVVPPLPPATRTGIRPLAADDADDYLALAAEAHTKRSGVAPTIDQIAAVRKLWDDDTVGGVVYEDDGELVSGLIWTATPLDRTRGRAAAHTALVAEVATATSAWGRGLASLLLHHSLADLVPLGYDTVELWTQADNRRARRLYEHHGFHRTSALPGIGRDGSTLVQYQRPL